MHPMLNIAVKAARRAGTIINRAAQDIDALTSHYQTENLKNEGEAGGVAA